MPTPLLPMNALQNTSYQPEAPEGYASSFETGLSVCDSRKTDYPDNEYCYTTLPQPEREELWRDGVAECFCTGWFKREVLSTPGFPSPIAHPPKVIYEVRAQKDCGLGVFATEDIKAGDLILTERPLVVKPIWVMGRVNDPNLSQELQLRGLLADMEQTMERVCSRMEPEAFEAYTSLYNSHKTDGSGPLYGIIRTNGFDVGVEDPLAPNIPEGKARYSCVGAVSSRFNHSCSPSATHNFNMSSFSMEVHAVRDVAKGEEITVTYAALNDKAADRQAWLKPYGFACVCPACNDPERSDAERKRVLDCLLPKTSQGVEFAEAALVAFEATGLQACPRYVDLLRRVSQIRRKKGSKERADALEALADRVDITQRRRKPVAPETPATGFTFGSTEDIMKFIMQHENPAVRANMMKAFMQIMAPGASSGTQVMGPNGMEMTMHASDVVDLSGSSE